MNRNTIISATRTYLVRVTQDTKYLSPSWVGHYILHNREKDDTTCPNCRSVVSKAFDVPEVGAKCVACPKCEVFTCYPQ